MFSKVETLTNIEFLVNMKLPKKVKIGGHWYKVLFPYKYRERHDIDGQRDGNLNEIRIVNTDSNGNELSESTIMVIFIHEIMHAIDGVSGHKIFRDKEDALEGTSEGIYQVLVDNKWLS